MVYAITYHLIHNVDENIYTMTKAERAEKRYSSDLPDTLHERIKVFG